MSNFTNLNFLSLSLAAQEYAKLGFHILPLHTINLQGLCSCGNPNCEKQGKHPRTKHGFKDATTDLIKIEKWWKDMPDSNIGLVTGEVSGIVVLDIDKDKSGYESLEYFEVNYGSLPETLKSQTGGGGQHIIFKHPDFHINNAVGIFSGIDIRADGAYIVAPPSIHISGNKYQWLERKEQ